MNFDIIEQKRIDKRYSVTELCKEVNIDRTSYYNYKRHPENMPIATLHRFAKALAMTKKEISNTIN